VPLVMLTMGGEEHSLDEPCSLVHLVAAKNRADVLRMAGKKISVLLCSSWKIVQIRC